MTWYYESFLVVPKGWRDWHKENPDIELRWKLHVVPAEKGNWKITTGWYGGTMHTKLDPRYLDKRYKSWQEAVDSAHIIVSTVAKSHQGLTWPEAKARIEAQTKAKDKGD